MAVNVNIVNRVVRREIPVGGFAGIISGGNIPTIPQRHWEIATLMNLQDKNVLVIFAEPFELTPVGKLYVYRMLFQNEEWREQNVLFSFANEDRVNQQGFEIIISAFEELTGVIVKYMFSEGEKIEGNQIIPPTSDLLTNLISLWDFETSISFLDLHGSSNGVSYNITDIVADVLSRAFDFENSFAKVIVPSTSELLLDALIDSYTIEMWIDRNNYELSGNDFVLLTKNPAGGGANSFLWEVDGVSGNLNISITDGVNTDLITVPSFVWQSSWFHVVMMIDHVAAKMNVYLNGSILDSIDLTITTSTIQSANSDIGMVLAPDTIDAGDAQIAITRLAIWGRVLTEDEITVLYNLGNGKVYNDF